MPIVHIIRAVGLLSAIVALPLSTAARAESLDGAYVSIDDFGWMDAGVITPIVEYVEIGDSFLGAPRIETGYLHIFGNPEFMLSILLSDYHVADGAVTDYGEVDLANARRVSLQGSWAVDDDRLSWVPSLFAPTVHEPGRLTLDGTTPPRRSPFLMATDAADTEETGSDDPVVTIVAFDGSTLAVRDNAGAVHRYVRSDLTAARMVGLLAVLTNVSIAQNRECLWPMAESLVANQDYTFSESAIAELEFLIETDTAAAETLYRMRDRGLGQLLWRVADSASQAWRHMGEYLAAKVEREGGLIAFFRNRDKFDPVIDLDDGLTPMLITRFHMFDEGTLAGTPPVTDAREAMDLLTEAYADDPFAQTAPMMLALDRHTWVGMMTLLLVSEIQVRCGNPY